jgi:putative toxin-antitoxin system antitoxin component (TIGR02293 family)
MTAAITQKPDRPAARGRVAKDLWSIIESIFDFPVAGEADLLKLVESGVPGKRYVVIQRRLSIPKGAVAPETTLRTRIAKKAARLTVDESERLVGITRVFALATELFGDESAALEWMHRPARLIPDSDPVKPIELAVRDSGVRLLEDRIRRTQHGIF